MNIGVFFGGKNPEHDVSVITGQLIISGLKKLGHTIVPIYIHTDGGWYIGDTLGELKFYTGGELKLHGLNEFSLDLKASRGRMVFKKNGMFGGTVTIDMAFPALHGQYGEDGTLQGLFEMFDIPYVGCGVAASAVAMDKTMTKLAYEALDVPTTRFDYFGRNSWEKDDKESRLNSLEQKLTYPLFVKPARLGSSIGITKAKSRSELQNALDVAFRYDTKVLVEEAVPHVMDVTCAVLNRSDTVMASKLQESTFAADFLSYDDKYLKEGGTQLGNAKKSVVIPATLDQETTDDIRNTALNIFILLGLSGTARIDFLYDSVSKKWYANEINTMPGTLYHHLWKESGVELSEVLTILIETAEWMHANKKSVTHTFASKLMDLAKSEKLRIKGS